MALDFVHQWHREAVSSVYPHMATERHAANILSSNAESLKWRQYVLAIVHDTLVEIDSFQNSDGNQIWRDEAGQRASNFAVLSLSNILTWPKNRPLKQRGWHLSSVSTLAGVYRLLAKCASKKPVQCEHILQKILTNLSLTYAPISGGIAFDVNLCSILLYPVECRALILCVGMLVQGAMRMSSNTGYDGRIAVSLTESVFDRYEMILHFNGLYQQLLDSPEFDLASRLSGIFRAELSCRRDDSDGLIISLVIPAINSNSQIDFGQFDMSAMS